MPGTTVPVHKLKNEERRNLILRLRYGAQMQGNKELSNDGLCIEGQAMIHKSRQCSSGVCNRLNPDERARPMSDYVVKNSLPAPKCYLGPELMEVKGASPTSNQLKAKISTSHHDLNSPYVNHGGGETTRFPKISEDTTQEADLRLVMQASAGEICGARKKNNKEEGSETLIRKNKIPEGTIRKVWSPGDEEERLVDEAEEKSANDEELRGHVIDVELLWKKKKKRSTNAVDSLQEDHDQNQSIVCPPLSENSHSKPPEDSHSKPLSTKTKIPRKRTIKKTETSKQDEDQVDLLVDKDKCTSVEPDFRPTQNELQDLEVTIIRKFTEFPESKPKHVCFDFPGVDLTHVDVRRAIEKVIPDAFETKKVIFVQFENINVKLGSGSKDNRWHIKLADFTTRNKLIKSGLTLYQSQANTGWHPYSFYQSQANTDMPTNHTEPLTPNGQNEDSMVGSGGSITTHRVEVRLYDMVMMEEYKLFLRRNAAAEKLQNVLLMSAGRRHNWLMNML